MEIYKKLESIQKALKAPKSNFNAFGKYKYRSCEDILESIKPLLNGATLVLSDTIRQVGDRYYIEAEATFSDGQNQVVATGYAREPDDKKGMDASQITGAASSYARKYALAGLFMIDDNKDADATNTGSDPTSAIEAIKTAKTLNELKSHYAAAFSLFQSDSHALASITKAKDERKEHLTEITK